MNEVIHAILERRSVRSYKPEPIADTDLEAIVQAGLHAPSSRNIQPWHVTVAQNPAVLERLALELKGATVRCNVERYIPMVNSPNYRMTFGAPVFVIVSADPSRTLCAVEDCALVLGNMFLAAHSLGIGSCWVNQLGPVADDPAFRAILTEMGVPEANMIMGAAAFGYNAGAKPKPAPRREGAVNYVK